MPALQRVRWQQGTLQAFFIKSNPITLPGLNPIQRLAYFEGLLQWFSSISRVGFLMMPLTYAFLGVVPLRASESELMYFFMPFYLVQLSVFSWLNYRSRSALLSDVYSLVLAFPLAITVFQVLLRPFSKGFNVTPKGTASDRYRFNWALAWPLVVVFALTALSLWVNLGNCLFTMANPAEHWRGLGVSWVWSAYNLLMLGIALLILLDAPRHSPYEWFNVQRIARVQLDAGAEVLWGYTTMVSEVGVEFSFTKPGHLDQQNLVGQAIELELVDEQLTVQGTISAVQIKDELPTLTIQFATLDLPQQRRLVELLFCRPGQWQSRSAPNELHSLWLIIKSVFRPRFIFDRQVSTRPVRVSKV